MRSLADSDSVFESACDYDEVYFIYVSVIICYFVQNLLDDSMEEGEITSEVLELFCIAYFCCIGDC